MLHNSMIYCSDSCRYAMHVHVFGMIPYITVITTNALLTPCYSPVAYLARYFGVLGPGFSSTSDAKVRMIKLIYRYVCSVPRFIFG